MKFLGIIPSRYASSRFPGKPLADLCGKSLIRRVYEQVYNLLDEVVVATDDERIFRAVQDFGGKVVMTSPDHRSGTDRCYEAYTKIHGDFDVVINVQGDEPFINPKQIELLKACFSDPQTQIATLVKPFSADTDFETLFNPNTPKVVINAKHQAIYFSRSVIPYIRGKNHEEWLKSNVFYKHIGIYAYKSEVLKQIAALPPTALEKAESLEQLRWIENDYTIKVGITDEETIGIDTPEDLEKAVLRIKTIL
jgi:3-deoxy-manno-octulosonate cytidylyltransferase (CMP-KDO synthetase)